MHFLWFINLFIFILFNSFLSGKASYDLDDSEERDHTNNLIISSKTTKSSILDEEAEKLDESDEKWKTKTTTSIEKTTKHSVYSSDDHEEYYENDENENEGEEEEEEKPSSTIVTPTTLLPSTSSSSSTLGLTTTIITETVTNKTEIPLRNTIRVFSTEPYTFDNLMFFTTTIDSEQIATYRIRANRDRLLLKIFTITVSIVIFGLAVVLIAIHIVRKTKRYHGYRTPANNTSNEQSKHLNNIYINST